MTFLTLTSVDEPPAPPDDWVPPSLSDPSGVTAVQVAVAEVLPDFRYIGELLQASVSDWWEDDRGGAGVTVTVPTDDRSIFLLLGTPVDWANKARPEIINRELHLYVDGKSVGCFKPSGQAKIGGGQMVLECESLTSAYFRGRTLGREPYDWLEGEGAFPDDVDFADIPWIDWSGDGDPDTSPTDIRWVPGARSGTRGLEIRGTPFDDGDPEVLTIQVHMTYPLPTTFNNIVRTACFAKVPDIPDTSDLDGRMLMTMERFDMPDLVTRVWPDPADAWPDETIAVVDEERTTGDWSPDPVTAAAVAKKGPYDSVFRTNIYPVSETEWTGIAEPRVFRRDNLGTGEPVDLTRHLALIAEDAQDTEFKSTWNLPVVLGAPCGISEVGLWHREDFEPATEAINAICDRRGGPAWPWVDYQRRLRCQATRGVDRSETMTIGPDQIVSRNPWTHDSGAQVSQIVAQTSYGENYWPYRAISTDTSRTDGHLIELIMRAPNDLGLTGSDQYADRQLEERSQAQETGTIWVAEELGWRLGVGDRFRLVDWDGYVLLDRFVSVTRRLFARRKRLIALDWGVNEDAE